LITHQCFVIHHLLRANAQGCNHILRLEVPCFCKSAASQVHPDALRDKLQQIAVPRDNFDCQPAGGCLDGYRTQYVIRFCAFLFQPGDMECVHHLADAFHLRSQIIRHLGAGGFVIREHVIPKRLAGIKRNRQVFRAILFEDAQQHGGKAENARRGFTTAGLQSLCTAHGKSKIGTIGKSMPINQV